jgi:hypothetical protein
MKVPDYVLALPKLDDVPDIVASCDKEDIDELKEIAFKGQCKLIDPEQPI